MNSYRPEALKQSLQNQIRRLETKISKLEKLSSRLGYIRFFDFALAIGLIYLAAQSGNTLYFFIILILGIGSFGALVRWHKRIDRGIERLEEWIQIRRNHLARINLRWDDIPPMDWQQNYDAHPFARDFDLVGQHSLLHLINTTTYPGGRLQLEEWMLQDEPDLNATRQRQELVKELVSKAHFRDRLSMYARLTRKKKKERDWDMEDLKLWLQSTQQDNYAIPLAILGTLSLANILLLALYLMGVVAPYVIFTFIAYALTYNLFSGRVSGLFGEAKQIQKLLSEFRPVLHYLESYSYKKDTRLRSFCRPFHETEGKPSTFLQKIIRIASAAASQESEIIWLLANILMPWDMFFARKLDSYKKELEPRLDMWLDRFYKLEALSAMANFAWLNPHYTFALPRDSNDKPVLKAEALGHPLIPESQKVVNDVQVDKVGDVQLVTGSNMAGKSTYLRTVGINLSLCFAGAPVDAISFDTILFRLFSSINVTDSLEEGLSHFYAEVKRLRTLIDRLEQPHEQPLFFMVDEIYRGTNNRERLAGSEAFLKHVVGKDGVGLVTTHDLELAQLENEIPPLSNWHFAETIEDGKMHFEYKLKPGPCPSTNAIKIMKMEGLPV